MEVREYCCSFYIVFLFTFALGFYSVKSCYNILCAPSENLNLSVKFDWKEFWNNKTPPKAKNTVWRGIHNCLPTRDRLLSKGVSVVNMCSVCNNEQESINHCLFSYPFAKRCWSLASIRFQANDLQTTADVFYQGWRKSNQEEKKLAIMIIWAIWKYRNEVVWRGKNKSGIQLVNEASSFLIQWETAQISETRDWKLLADQDGSHSQAVMAEALSLKEALSWIKYRWIALLSIFIGCCFAGIFHFGTEEPRLVIEAREKGHTRVSWVYWFNKVLYYQVALVYVLTRLVTNISNIYLMAQAFLAFYVVNDLKMIQSSKAVVPAVIYISDSAASLITHEITWTGQRSKVLYSAGGLLWIISGAGILFHLSSMSLFMYILSIVIGSANALMMVSGVSIQSFLVGTYLNECAFVYRSLSFMDKVSCGLALCILEFYQSCARF
ncbi:uncharacterized protein [Henckelia pumila]|uniref:uncharacterized protein n=1 Tax=Henckelia pumila TaxID=405737 RepID=UPI003C6E21F9